MRSFVLLIYALLFLPLAAGTQASAQGTSQSAPPGVTPGVADDNPMAARLSAEKASNIESGLYNAGDSHAFTLAPAAPPNSDKVLLRFPDSAETFVLTVDRASLGAKVLKYDTGATAIRISIWGGLTLYTQADPSGLPATRQDDLPPGPAEPEVSTAELTAALGDEASHLSYVQNVGLHFSADPAVLGGDDQTRVGAFAALTNAGRGIERFLAMAPAKKAMAGRLESVKIAEGSRPAVVLSGRSLLVSFVPGQGVAGAASSHAVAHALGKLLAVATAE